MSERRGMDAQLLVASALERVDPDDRPGFLRELLDQTARALLVTETEEIAAECAYRVADKLVGSNARKTWPPR